MPEVFDIRGKRPLAAVNAQPHLGHAQPGRRGGREFGTARARRGHAACRLPAPQQATPGRRPTDLEAGALLAPRHAAAAAKAIHCSQALRCRRPGQERASQTGPQALCSCRWRSSRQRGAPGRRLGCSVWPGRATSSIRSSPGTRCWSYQYASGPARRGPCGAAGGRRLQLSAHCSGRWGRGPHAAAARLVLPSAWRAPRRSPSARR